MWQALTSGNAKWGSEAAVFELFDEAAVMITHDKQVFNGKTAILRRLNQGGCRVPGAGCRVLGLVSSSVGWVSEHRYAMVVPDSCGGSIMVGGYWVLGTGLGWWLHGVGGCSIADCRYGMMMCIGTNAKTRCEHAHLHRMFNFPSDVCMTLWLRCISRL